jgi:hypothetical protein
MPFNFGQKKGEERAERTTTTTVRISYAEPAARLHSSCRTASKVDTRLRMGWTIRVAVQMPDRLAPGETLPARKLKETRRRARKARMLAKRDKRAEVAAIQQKQPTMVKSFSTMVRSKQRILYFMDMG